MLRLISVHVPKCAGTAFAQTLQQAYGADKVYLDYADRPVDPSSPMHLDPEGFFESFAGGAFPFGAEVEVVHGHFNLRKYRAVDRACPRITFLRDPVDRTLSHYAFWQKLPRHGHRLHDYVLDRGLGIVEFARLPFIRHFYRDVIFGGVERDELDFVGSVETLERDMARLSALVGRPLAAFTTNVGPRDEVVESAVREELTDLLAGEIALYRRWCAPS